MKNDKQISYEVDRLFQGSDTNFSRVQNMASHSSYNHIDALLLAFASSTDNFTVGLSVGIRQKSLPMWANFLISVCNATGAYTAVHGGAWLSHFVSGNFPLYLSALAFGGLAFSEWRQYLQHCTTEGDIDAESMQKFQEVLTLAVPMTLNNLAGGVAGGAAGLTPEIMATYALLASFVTMWAGHSVGKHLGVAIKGNKRSSGQSWFHPSLIAAGLLGILFFLTLQEAMLRQ